MRIFNHYILPLLWILVNIPTTPFGNQSYIVRLLSEQGLFSQLAYVAITVSVLFIFLLMTHETTDNSNRLLILSGFVVVIFSLVNLAKMIAVTYEFSVPLMLYLLQITVPIIVLAILLLVLIDWLLGR